MGGSLAGLSQHDGYQGVAACSNFLAFPETLKAN
jgi:hypothetical protein